MINKNINIEPEQYFLKEEPYEGSHAPFYNSKDFPAIVELEKNWEIIKEEVLGIVTDAELSNIKNLNPPYLSHSEAWKNIYFYNFGWKNHENCHRFPRTHTLLMNIPYVIFGGITVLEGHSRVLPHNGETNTTIRCHLGLKVPAHLPICGVKVGTDEQSWHEGKVTMFSDAHYHTTWNDSSERRYVLIFDIIRQEYSNHSSLICAKVLGALSLKYFYSKYPNLKATPYPILYIIHHFFTTFWFIYRPIQNRISFLP